MKSDDLDKVITIKKVKVKGQLSSTIILYSKEIIIAVIVGVMITVFSAVILDYFSAEIDMEEDAVYLQPPSQVVTVNHRSYIVRAGLANVLASLTPLKMQIQMHFQMMGEFPTKKKDIAMSSFDLEEYDQINSSFMTEIGGIGVYLSEVFGNEKFLVLEPKISTNGSFIKWRCVTNVNEKYLGIPANRICDFQDSWQ
ncbi:MAG: pilin [Colwellia sp.]|nr:pilin [Colwellia sp.]